MRTPVLDSMRLFAATLVVLLLTTPFLVRSARAQDPDFVTTSAARGPVTMSVVVSPASARVGDAVTIVIEATAPDGVDIVMPDLGRWIGDFLVRDIDLPPALHEDGMRTWLHSYVVDTFAAGRAEIPPFSLTFADRRDADNAIDGSVTSEALAIEVASALSDGESEVRGMRGAVEVPVPGDVRRTWQVVAIAAVVAVAAALIAWMIIVAVRRPKRAPPPRPAHEVALEAIAALRREELVDHGHVDALFDRLSSIVRLYLEGRFGIHAPDRTTDEFLQEAARAGTLGEGHRVLLGSFLRAADLVKFARHQPDGAEGNEVLDRAEGFVRETTPGEAVT